VPAEIRFGTDGWRGIVADDFTFANVRRVVQAIADHLNARAKGNLAVVGYDCRFGSEVFAEEAARVFAGNGIETLIFDRPSPTQVASWTVIDRKAQGAVAITASHNPYLFNGVKFKPETGSSAPREVVQDFETRVEKLKDEDVKRAEDEGLITRYDPRAPYFAQVGRMVDLEKLRGAGLKILHECMHGSGYGYIQELLQGGKTAVTQLHADRNPFFGGVNPEPIERNLGEAIEAAKGGGYDLCIATDGDADRLGILDERGGFLTTLQVYALLMLYLFEVRGWRGPVVKTVNMTSMADELARQFGVEVYEVPVGFPYVAPKMMETQAVLGGEESGGYGIKGHIPERDGILAGLFFADMIVSWQRPLSEILKMLEERVGRHAYTRRDLHLPRDTYDRDRKVILKTLKEREPKQIAGQQVVKVREDDGVKFYLKDGSWVLLRTSGTEPLIRIYSEAGSQDEVDERLDTIQELIGVGGEGGG
jgi:phosphomannomutase